jgi:hypothetical protein
VIIDLDYVDGLLPTMAGYRRKGYDFKIHYETKSNLKKHQVRAMSDAGIKSIQPGIESISNTILKLMLVEARLVYEEEGQYLSLAIPTNVEAEEFEIEAQESEPLPMLVQIGPASRPVISCGTGVLPVTHA